MASLREQKEAFVTGHEGTSPWEILLIIFTTPIGLTLYQAATDGAPRRFKWQLVCLESLSLIIPMILCQSNIIYPWGLGYLCLILIAGCHGLSRMQLLSVVSKTDPPLKVPLRDRRTTTLTIYRASLMFMTFIAILAVDFQVFPRRFVKTETQGYSLMDVGAASFVVAAGLVSPRSRGRAQNAKKLILRMIPLLLMGFLRLLTHKGIDYQEHVSEYGVHWNFFFTLSMLSPAACLVPGPSLVLPLSILSVYQLALSHGLQEWVVQAPRACATTSLACNLLIANREGVLGSISYASLYLISEWIGAHFIWTKASVKRSIQLMFCLGCVWIVLTEVMGMPVSRRTTNAPFIAWILFINLLQLFAIDCVVGRGARVPPWMEAVNENGLIMFVVANLLTGLTNVSINTLSVPDGMALGILFLYIHAVGGFANALHVMLRARRKLHGTERKRS